VAPPRDPAPGEVLCRTVELGVCGTDREILHSAKPLAPPGEDILVLGHECLGTVESVGPGVTGFRRGDLVIPIVRRALPNQTGRVDLLPFGAYVERGIVREHGFSPPLWLDRPEHLFHVPSEIADLAILAEPMTVSEKAINEAWLLTQARLGTDVWTTANPPRVLVTGMGPIGFTAVVASVARGWPVTMLGRDQPDSFRAELAGRLGGRYERLSDCESLMADIQRDGYDLLLECTGSDSVMLATAGLIRSCGVIVWLGSTRVPQPAMHNVQRLMREGLLRNHIHLGCVNAAPRDFHDALKHLSLLAKDRREALAKLITARVRPADSLWHYEHRQPQGIKTVLMYS
jgi:threonine dehydrogenase-like Zn-dependent dehydrogenase